MSEHGDGFQPAKAAIEVTAGLIPGQPQPEYTRRWWITSAQWQQAKEPGVGTPVSVPGRTPEGDLLTDVQGPAMAYAQLLMLQPHVFNFVRVDWIWF